MVFDAATIKELASFEKHMKDPKFRDLFAEYVKEISDPKNKKVIHQTPHIGIYSYVHTIN
jgi:hypothetical protein